MAASKTFVPRPATPENHRNTDTMPAKKKTAVPAIETVEQLHETVDEIARLEVEKRRLEAERDQAVQSIVALHDGRIEEIKKRLKALLSLSSTFAVAHKATIFGRLKSAFSKLARFGFRDGNPSLCLLNRKHSWESVLAALKESGRTEFIRTVEEVNKEKLKDAKLSDADLAAVGLRIDQGVKFFVESKAEEASRLTAKPEEEAAA